MNKKILIVDDEKITLRMTEHILSTQYQVISALNGHDAIAVYKKERPDMILSDLHMPGMSGFELQNTLQDLYAERIPFMFMTSDTSDEAESRGLDNGAVDFIRKPFRADVLLMRVDKILSHAEEIQGLRQAAQTDPMTGLLNKASSQLEIGQMCKECVGVLMMIDLDNFKLVNDLYGHNMGDKILIRFAETIRAQIRSSDTAGRMGGDEFIAFCQNIRDKEVIAEKAASINDELQRFAHEMMGEDMTIPLGASVGAVFVPDEGTDFLTLYRKADKALYQVKQNGKHGYAIFREERAIRDDQVGKLHSDIDEVMQILGERNRSKGAYRLTQEQFVLLYRFLVRVEINYNKNSCLIVFSLDDEDNRKAPEEVSEKLYEVVCASLRQSDAATPRGNNQVMVLLYEAADTDTQMVIDRVKGHWEQEDSGFKLSWESKTIR